MVENNKYLLSVGKKDSIRLDVVDKIYGKHSKLLLSEVGVCPGMTILDVGCGTGNISCWLAKEVGWQGKIYAVDSSIEQLELAKSKTMDDDINNIEFLHLRGEDLNTLKIYFDVVYCRFCLFHIRNPMLVLENMYSLVKDGGYIVCEEPVLSTALCYPSNKAYSRVRLMFQKLCRLEGLDPEIGFKLKEMFISVGCKKNKVSFSQPVLNFADEKLFEYLALTNIAEKYIQHNLFNDSEIKELLKELKKLSQNEQIIMSPARVTQIYGVKE